jgi:hypothetical protein
VGFPAVWTHNVEVLFSHLFEKCHKGFSTLFTRHRLPIVHCCFLATMSHFGRSYASQRIERQLLTCMVFPDPTMCMGFSRQESSRCREEGDDGHTSSGTHSVPETVVPEIGKETLAEMVGITRRLRLCVRPCTTPFLSRSS